MNKNKKVIAGVVDGVVALGAVCSGIGYLAAPNPVPQDVIDAQLNASYNAGVDSVEPTVVNVPGPVKLTVVTLPKYCSLYMMQTVMYPMLQMVLKTKKLTKSLTELNLLMTQRP